MNNKKFKGDIKDALDVFLYIYINILYSYGKIIEKIETNYY